MQVFTALGYIFTPQRQQRLKKKIKWLIKTYIVFAIKNYYSSPSGTPLAVWFELVVTKEI